MIRKLASRVRDYLSTPLHQQLQHQTARSSPTVSQNMLFAMYRQQYHSNGPKLQFHDVGFRAHSQFEEDGILLFLFSLIGTTNKKSVEVCASNGIECNTANLLINHRWRGLLCDGNEAHIATAREFYSNNLDTKYWPPAIVHAWITRHNINKIIIDADFAGDVDLLSLDIDGNDYWIWESINCISPRVVVLEYNHLWGPEVSVSTPYRDDFVAEFSKYGSDYAGASLSAFIKLGRTKGYRLIGTNEVGTNAFFLRNDIECSWLPEIAAASCFSHPRAQFGMTKRLPNVKDKEWVTI